MDKKHLGRNSSDITDQRVILEIENRFVDIFCNKKTCLGKFSPHTAGSCKHDDLDKSLFELMV